ncbi:uncharacterized protein LOC118700753 [Molothrus ater]|uniref:uncharacterized protein LOC118700753 n=1 Tax=Molothrus ater TaxID=84834 RepID=UPI00174D689D|nr:uncharacterized protein LOC118700753 [Molothrus ater]
MAGVGGACEERWKQLLEEATKLHDACEDAALAWARHQQDKATAQQLMVALDRDEEASAGAAHATPTGGVWFGQWGAAEQGEAGIGEDEEREHGKRGGATANGERGGVPKGGQGAAMNGEWRGGAWKETKLGGAINGRNFSRSLRMRTGMEPKVSPPALPPEVAPAVAARDRALEALVALAEALGTPDSVPTALAEAEAVLSQAQVALRGLERAREAMVAPAVALGTLGDEDEQRLWQLGAVAEAAAATLEGEERRARRCQHWLRAGHGLTMGLMCCAGPCCPWTRPAPPWGWLRTVTCCWPWPWWPCPARWPGGAWRHRGVTWSPLCATSRTWPCACGTAPGGWQPTGPAPRPPRPPTRPPRMCWGGWRR